MMNMKLKKVYQVSKKADKPRLFLQHIVCEAAGFEPGEPIYIRVNEEQEEILIQNHTFQEVGNVFTVHVSSRKNRVSGKERPLVDTAGDKYSSFLDIKQKIEVTVFRKGPKSQIFIKPLRYSLFENKTLSTQKDERIRLLSLCSGAGVGTACMVDTQYFSAIQEVELEEDSAEVLLRNFPNSMVFNGDMRDLMEIPQVDVAMVTLPCNEHSSLGHREGNVMNDLVIAAAKIIKSSQASMLFFENVPSFYRSDAWTNLKQLLIDEYPFWIEKNIEAWDFGSLATRNRTYVIACAQEDIFQAFQFPSPPKMRRKKLKDYLDAASVHHEWKSLKQWMESFQSRRAWRERNIERTFVSKEVDKINCIPARYTSHSASSSYVLSEDKQSWRFLSINEIKRILNVPDWFEFCEHTPKIRKYEMLGQSVDGTVIRAIANRIAYAFMKAKTTVANMMNRVRESYNVNSYGQIEMLI